MAEAMSKYTYLFMTAMLEKQKANFNFNREINDRRIQNMRTMLPISENGEPDYEFMEEYVRYLLKKKYIQYLSYIKKQVDD